MPQSTLPTYNRKAFYAVHGVGVLFDLIVIGICARMASDTVQNQIETPRGGRYRPILLVVAVSPLFS